MRCCLCLCLFTPHPKWDAEFCFCLCLFTSLPSEMQSAVYVCLFTSHPKWDAKFCFSPCFSLPHTPNEIQISVYVCLFTWHFKWDAKFCFCLSLYLTSQVLFLPLSVYLTPQMRCKVLFLAFPAAIFIVIECWYKISIAYPNWCMLLKTESGEVLWLIMFSLWHPNNPCLMLRAVLVREKSFCDVIPPSYSGSALGFSLHSSLCFWLEAFSPLY